MPMATVSFRVPDDLKARMDTADLNWSEIFREVAEERLLQLQRRKAAEKMDRMREEILRRNGGKFMNLSEDIIRWRRLH